MISKPSQLIVTFCGLGIFLFLVLIIFYNKDATKIIGSKIVWDGVIETNMTYGRVIVRRIPEDSRYPLFIVEDYDGKILHGEHGSKVRIWGEVEGVHECLPEECSEDQLIPWVLVEKIENIN